MSDFSLLALLYGPVSSMPSHVDAPSRPESREQWLVSITLGLCIIFQVGDHRLHLRSGDVLVMDAMALMHGVIAVLADSAPADVVLQDSRLGLLLFEPPPQRANVPDEQENVCVDGLEMLFATD